MNNLTNTIEKDEMLKNLSGIKSCLDQLNTAFEKILADVFTEKAPPCDFNDLKSDLAIFNKIKAAQILYNELHQFPIQHRLHCQQKKN